MRYGQSRTIVFSFSSRGRCILFDQSLRFQFGPEFSGNVGLHRGIVSENLLFTAGADYQSCSYGGCRSELKRCGTQVHPVIGRHFPQFFPFFQEFDRNLVRLFPIVVARAPEMNPAFREEPTTREAFFFRTAGKSWFSAFL
jgi:hypothetical protein